MDFSKFSDDNFDMKDWINGAFKTQKESNQNAEQFTATLITKLQVFIQEINNSIDETSHQTIQNFPKILREIEVLKQESLMLKEQMKNARDDINKVEKNTVDTMKLLLDLDRVKINMIDASNALQQADNWSTLTSDLDKLLDSQDVNKITNRILGMQECLQILQDDDSPDYTNRCLLLKDFKNKFETQMSADIVKAFNTKSLESSRNYSIIFEKIERSNEFKKYYLQCEKRNISDRLDDFTRSVSDTRDFVKNWYDFLVDLWKNELKWCKQLFPDPIEIVINLLIDSLNEFNKKLNEQLDTFVTKNDSNLIDYLKNLKDETDKFLLTIQSNIEPSIKSSAELTELSSKFLTVLYDPFKQLIKSYGKFESTRLQRELEAIKLTSIDNLESVQLLGLSVSKLITNAEKAIERCQQLTFGCGFQQLNEALNTYFKSYLSEFKRVAINLKERSGNTSKTSEDWDLFRHFIKIIQIFGDYINEYEKFKENFVSKIKQNVLINEQQDENVMNFSLTSKNCKNLMLSEIDKMHLDYFLSQIKDDLSTRIGDISKKIKELSERLHQIAFDIVFAPIKKILHGLSQRIPLAVSSASSQIELPSFSLAPQEYITKIGQYLLTLPQNFEPFIMQDNYELVLALKYGKLPYLEESYELESDHITACWLDSIANGTLANYCEELLRISKLNEASCKQLVVDIEYICNVFDDVGLRDYSSLKEIEELLKTSNKDTFQLAAKNKPIKVVNAIRHMKDF